MGRFQPKMPRSGRVCPGAYPGPERSGAEGGNHLRGAGGVATHGATRLRRGRSHADAVGRDSGERADAGKRRRRLRSRSRSRSRCCIGPSPPRCRPMVRPSMVPKAQPTPSWG